MISLRIDIEISFGEWKRTQFIKIDGRNFKNIENGEVYDRGFLYRRYITEKHP